MEDHIADFSREKSAFRRSAHAAFGAERKLRWPATDRGKRGGYRIIYFPRLMVGTIWLLTLYPKNVSGTIPAGMLRRLREEIEDGEE